jgi:hypothetical protein
MQHRPSKDISLVDILLGQFSLAICMRCYRSRRRSQSVAGQNGGRPRHVIAVKELEETATHAPQAESEVQETETFRFLLWLGRGNPP